MRVRAAWVILGLLVGTAQAEESYTVKAGDTLKGIALAHQVSEDSILAANPKVSSPDKIWPGQKIIIPAPGTGLTEATPPPAAPAENPAARPRTERLPPTNDVLVSHPAPRQERWTPTTPAGRLLVEGLTWKGSASQWDLVLTGCKKGGSCSGQITLKNNGDQPIEDLQVTSSTWQPGLTVTPSCGPLTPGASCTVRVQFDGATSRAYPGMILIGAADALISPEVNVVWIEVGP